LTTHAHGLSRSAGEVAHLAGRVPEDNPHLGGGLGQVGGQPYGVIEEALNLGHGEHAAKRGGYRADGLQHLPAHVAEVGVRPGQTRIEVLVVNIQVADQLTDGH